MAEYTRPTTETIGDEALRLFHGRQPALATIDWANMHQPVDHPDSRALAAGICSPLDIIRDLGAFAAGRGGITYATPRPTRAELQAKHREQRRARRIDRRAWLAFSRLTYRLWLRPRRWRDAWAAHHERWWYDRHGCDDCW